MGGLILADRLNIHFPNTSEHNVVLKNENPVGTLRKLTFPIIFLSVTKNPFLEHQARKHRYEVM